MFEQVQELKKQYQIIPATSKEFDGDGGVIISALQEKFRSYRLLIDTRPVHTLVIGSERSGKGETFLFPMIDVQSRAKNKPSLVINDARGELAAASYETLVARGYDVYVFNVSQQCTEMALDLTDIGFGDKPIAIFVVSSDWSSRMLASKFLSHLYRVNVEKAIMSPGGKTKRLVHFLLDDLGNMPPIEGMAEMIAVSASKGFRFHLIFQIISQLKGLYRDAADTIIGNCSNQIYIGIKDKTTADQLSAFIGMKTIIGSQSGKKEQSLLIPEDLMYLKDGESVVVRTNKGLKPIFNRGITAAKFRHEYLAKDFDKNKSILALK
ncbi:type IV secretory system conjugative DNA transfer family protein [Lysinibacillus fusiformis]|uniref:type IV secretory system conjugative DNA transfer family protein n=1 Tax=Lysinibacillus fusiformis TaxID=28031 RepID=UPI000D34E46E|nr:MULTISPECIES: type IV secretory system conjugative DNA transfer family protein [Lysinibacillus]MED4669771.1 type IV secretory system conjugative DNA transfer family protein [Lysinibacillus fusiformis]QAS55730.1 hypothetical protein LSP_04705 [Lysinibacillus sphaericus]RDV27630.1 hypothetical protein C7B90_19455 [Lysinibacillus fusiformis]GED64029.1 hypothetical protein LFU01_24810 [Lysinibacillus fusiformis]